ncbi:hypothetical protein PCASD_04847 [Puccinia coronata f. sp. avenae]|uniref:Vacuolar protein sorting-associated protein 54 n=1 Tax=Puccinia coronata f. sp. avenae TaxID=200324 RepID=A0A2N5V2A9_9BASI|nr:hypothetical protein PCASD_04847 [Puccinia coronata f. sp. avenae]
MQSSPSTSKGTREIMKEHRNGRDERRSEHGEEDDNDVESTDESISRPFLLRQNSHYQTNYPISTVMNQVSPQNITVTAFNAIRSSIPINLKPPPLSSLVKLPYGQQQSVLAPSNKRSAPPPIKLSRSPTIPLSDFDSYLEQVQVQYDRWQSTITANSKAIDSLQSDHSTDSLVNYSNQSDPLTAQALDSATVLPSLSSVPHVFFDQKFSLNDPLTFDLLTQQPSQASPATSSTVSHPSSTHPKTIITSGSNADLTTDHILLDKLSHYLDLVELHLVQEISLRSSGFFSALGNLQSLHAQTSSSVAQIDTLKKQLDQLKQTVSDRALKIIRYGIRRRNITSIELALTKLNDVWQTVHGIEQLIQSGEWQSALSLIQDLEQLWHSSIELSPTSPRDAADSNTSSTVSPPRPIKLRLSKLKALTALPKRLSVFRSTISKALVAELSSILSHDLKVNLAESANYHSLDQVQLDDVKSPVSSPLKSSTQSKSQPHDRTKGLAQERLKTRIRSTFGALVKAGGIEKALAAWREGVVKQIREIVKNALSDVVEGDLDDKDDSADLSQVNIKDKRNTLSDKTMTLARNLKALKHENFLKIAETTYGDLVECIELVDAQSRALLELAEELKNETSPAIHSDLPEDPLPGSVSPKIPSDREPVAESDQSKAGPSIDIDTLGLKLSEVVQSSAELANARFAKVIGVRTDIHSQLSFTDFFAIFDASWRFVVQCEVISRRMIIALRGVMVNQAKAFLQSFHQNKITESAKIVEQEQWAPVEVPSKVQQTVNSIIRSAMEDPENLVITRNRLSVCAQDKVADPTPSSKLLEIEGAFYHPVSAGLQTIETIADYLKVVVNCSLLTTDLMGKIIEFLKAFNSRTCQVVLGAGAIRSAGLKNITAKHLALASQALSTMISLIPYIRECLRRHLNMKQAVMLVDFDKLKRDYQEHQNEVHAKLVSIMADRLGVHKQTLEAIDWEKSENLTSDQDVGPNTYLESLLKEVGTLHRVLGRYLSSSTLEAILSQVFMSIHGVLHEEFSRVEVKSLEAKERVLRDAQYFSTKLVELKASEECLASAKELEEMVRNRLFPGVATKGGNATAVKSPDATQYPLPPSPLVERTSNFRAKFRFLSPRGRGPDSSASLLAEITKAATSSTAEEDASPAAVSPGGSVTAAENEPDGSKPTDSSVINHEDGSQQVSTELKSAGSGDPVNSSPAPATAELPSLPDKEQSTLAAPQDSSAASSAPLTSPPLKLSLSQRLAALASTRRGSQPSLTTIAEVGSVNASSINDNEAGQNQSASLLAEVIKATTSSTAEEDASPAAVSQGGLVAVAGNEPEGSKPTDSSVINHHDGSQQVSAELKSVGSVDPVNSSPVPTTQKPPSLPDKEQSLLVPPQDPSVASSAPLTASPMKLSLSQRLTALASSRRGSHPPPSTIPEAGSAKVPRINDKEEGSIKPVLAQEQEAGDRVAGPQELTADQNNDQCDVKPEKSGDSLNPDPVSNSEEPPPLPSKPPFTAAPSDEPSAQPSASLSSSSTKVPLSQRLAALASSRRGSNPSTTIISQVAPLNVADTTHPMHEKRDEKEDSHDNPEETISTIREEQRSVVVEDENPVNTEDQSSVIAEAENLGNSEEQRSTQAEEETKPINPTESDLEKLQAKGGPGPETASPEDTEVVEWNTTAAVEEAEGQDGVSGPEALSRVTPDPKTARF